MDISLNEAVLLGLTEAYMTTNPYGIKADELEVRAGIYAQHLTACEHTDPAAVLAAIRKCVQKEPQFPVVADIIKQLASPVDGRDALPGESWDDYMKRRKHQDARGLPAPAPDRMYRIVNSTKELST